MTALEELKQELINQKNAIEEKGGTVIVANDYPSPAEITAGIKTIVVSATSTANATSEIVASSSTTIGEVESTTTTTSNI